MRQSPAAPPRLMGDNGDEDLALVQRQIDFQKYLHSQKVLREKMARKAVKISDREMMAQIDINQLRNLRKSVDDSEAYEWDEYIEDEFDDDSHQK